MKNSFYSTQRRRAAFTLLELLVAMAVLLGVTLMIASLITSVTTTTHLGERTIASDSTARLFLSRLGADIDSMLVRNDVDFLFYKETGDDDALGFYVNLPAEDGAMPISRVFYQRIGSPRSEISRAIERVDTSWTAPIYTDSPSLQAGGDGEAFAIPANDRFQSFGAGIIRFEYCFLTEGAEGLTVAHDPSTGIGEIRNLRGLMVAIAVLDEEAQAILSAGEIDDLAEALLDSNSGDIVAQWQGYLAPIIANGGATGRAASNIRLYQRIFLLPR